MKLADRVRELRYRKGWGPDDLATRAKVSRTALYHLESGRTGRPQAGTLKKIARALDVSPEELLRECGSGHEGASDCLAEPSAFLNLRDRRARGNIEVRHPGEVPGGVEGMRPIALHRVTRPPKSSPESAEGENTPAPEDKITAFSSPTTATWLEPGKNTSGIGPESARHLIEKFTILLCSPMGKGIAQIVEESFRLLPIFPGMSVPIDPLYGHGSQAMDQAPDTNESGPSSRRTSLQERTRGRHTV